MEDTDEDVAWVDTDGGDICVEDCALMDGHCKGKGLLCLFFCWKQSWLILFKESTFELCLHRSRFGSVIYFSLQQHPHWIKRFSHYYTLYIESSKCHPVDCQCLPA